jgi:regulator of protease activity HflC (stomatin/prohibitin superfamily)
MAKQSLSYASPARPENDLRMQQRAVSGAWWGLAMQALLTIVVMILGNVGQWRLPLLSVFAIAGWGLIPWLAILIATAFRRYAIIEDFELETARRTGEADRTIFATEADARPAARRLARVYRWVLPAAALLLGFLLAWRGFFGLRSGTESISYILPNARYLAGLFAGFAFVGFVLGRYLLGMSMTPAWSILRGGATYLIGTVYIMGLMALSAGAAALGVDAVNGVVRFIVPLFALLVGIEVVLNIVLDLYRPKAAGEEPRPAFDSRLLSLLASPASVVQSLNEAVNYQFGFEITRSWFWRLLSRSFGWLILFGIAVLVLMSSLVIVEPHERALVTSFGQLKQQPKGPGVHVKWPWPLAMVDKYPVERVGEMVVGSHDEIHFEEALLWTNQHSEFENLVLVAGGTSAGGREPTSTQPAIPDEDVGATGGGRGLSAARSAPTDAAAADPSISAPSIALAAADVFIQWKIDESRLLDFATSAEQPEQRLRQLALAAVTREMLKYDIDAAIGVARPQISRAIHERLLADVEREKLGIEVLWVGLVSVHPPQDVAEQFNASAGAVQGAQLAIEKGREDEMRLLTAAAGSVEAARTIVAEHEKLQQLRRAVASGQASQEQLEAQQAHLELLIQRAGGAAARELLEARQRRWQAENSAVASAALQPVEFASFQQAPRYYWYRRYLEVLADSMADKRKFLLMNDDENPLIDLDFTEVIDALEQLQIQERAGQDRE